MKISDITDMHNYVTKPEPPAPFTVRFDDLSEEGRDLICLAIEQGKWDSCLWNRELWVCSFGRDEYSELFATPAPSNLDCRVPDRAKRKGDS